MLIPWSRMWGTMRGWANVESVAVSLAENRGRATRVVAWQWRWLWTLLGA